MRIVFEYLMVAAGCVIMALGFNTFCIPHNIAPGGFSGLGAIIYYVTGFRPARRRSCCARRCSFSC